MSVSDLANAIARSLKETFTVTNPLPVSGGGGNGGGGSAGTPITINNALAPSSAISGTKTITAVNTFEVLRTTTELRSGVWVQADSTNTGLVTVRVTGATDGLVLEKKDAYFFAIDDPAKLEVAVAVTGERVRWWGS